MLRRQTSYLQTPSANPGKGIFLTNLILTLFSKFQGLPYPDQKIPETFEAIFQISVQSRATFVKQPMAYEGVGSFKF